MGDDVAAVLETARAAGVARVVTIGTDAAESETPTRASGSASRARAAS